MERGRGVGETHVLVIPYPVQGHINPMLQFSKRLASKGLKVTLITTTPTNKSKQPQSSSINMEHIPVGLQGEEESLDDYLERFKLIVSSSLVELIGRYNGSEYPVRVLVYDSVMSWAQDIVERLSVDGAPFFTQSCAVSTIYYHVNQGAFKIPLEGPTVSIPSMPILGVNDLPSFINDTSSYPTLWSLVKTQFSNFEKVNWVFFNTFCELEDEVVKWLASKRPIKTIGPTIPSMYLDRRIDDDEDYGLSLFKPNADACITWLDTKDTVSVVYVSFGSLASLGEEQMEELAWGLKRSNSQFLWVVRELEKKKLPSNFVEETSEKGLVVSWCPQLEVLAHKAVGCFMTHCGWNSTLEALSLGVPMVAMPQWTDQTTNAKFIEDVWGVGVRVKVGENGIVKREEIKECIREVMEGERGNVMQRNAQRWKELAKEAVNEGGSSDNNIEEFVARLVCS
ncbi:mogroside IE synthase [Vitis vinifera]|nr:mogroside IE synthase [Vitis vinifera]|eukprot:XP_003632087.1 PREDICTED: UDP-glycosyltransferase 74E2 [Vitis vinifera]